MANQLLPASVDSILPKFDWDDNNKRTYLSWCVCGFTKLDARRRTGITPTTVNNWLNSDSAFAEIHGKNMQELRQLYAKEFLKLEFYHNMKLALEKDRIIFEKSLETDKRKKGLDKEEWQYLRTIRPMYNAKEIASLEGLLSDLGNQDWNEMVIMVKKNGSQASPQSSTQERIVETEYPEGSVIESGTSGWTPETDDT